MKVLFLLFIVSITYSHSIDIQRVQIGNFQTYLRTSKNEDYFYFSIDSYYVDYYLYLFLLVNDYNLNQIYFCRTNTYPSQSSIDRCPFYSLSNDYSESYKILKYIILLSSTYYKVFLYNYKIFR